MVFRKLWLGLSTLILASALQANHVIELNLKDLVGHLIKVQSPDERASILRAIIEQLRLPGSKAEAAAVIRGNGDIRAQLIEQVRPKSFTDFIAEPMEITTTCNDCARTLNDIGIDLNIEPTGTLLLKEAPEQKPMIQRFFDSHPKAQQTFETALSHEKKLKKDGYLTLYHACRKEIYAMAYLDTKLMELFQGNKPYYLKLRQPLGNYTPTEEPSKTRNHFLTNGTDSDHRDYDRYHLLCANHALTGNLGNCGECTAYFFADNSNISSPVFDVNKIFAQYKLATYYEKYKEKIDKALEFEMRGGVLLQLAFTPDLINKTVYVAHACGPKRDVSINGAKEENPSVILNALMQRPFSVASQINGLQWRVILTDDILLNPKSPELLRGDFKVFTHSMEQDKLAAFHKRIDAIVAQIRKDALADKIGGIHAF
jgi:hypothetical protein